MIVVDTNVLSEPLRSRPDTAVVDWLDQQQVETLFITALSVAELRLGAALLPPGRRRDRLVAALDTVVLHDSQVGCWYSTRRLRRSGLSCRRDVAARGGAFR